MQACHNRLPCGCFFPIVPLSIIQSGNPAFMHDLFLQILLLLLATISAQWVAWRLHTPAILFLLALGFLLGPVLGMLHPAMLMGDLLRPAIAAAVAIILFEGALQLRLAELRETRGAVLRIILLGGPLGCVLISAGAY